MNKVVPSDKSRIHVSSEGTYMGKGSGLDKRLYFLIVNLIIMKKMEQQLRRII